MATSGHKEQSGLANALLTQDGVVIKIRCNYQLNKHLSYKHTSELNVWNNNIFTDTFQCFLLLKQVSIVATFCCRGKEPNCVTDHLQTNSVKITFSSHSNKGQTEMKGRWWLQTCTGWLNSPPDVKWHEVKDK